MAQHPVRKDPLLRIAIQHRHHEVLEQLSLSLLESVLGYHDVLDGPVLQFGNSPQVALLTDILSILNPPIGHLLGKPPQQLHHLGQVLIILSELLIRVLLGVKQQLPRQQLERHAGQ